MEIFQVDGAGAPNTGNKRLMARRGYVAVVAYDPEIVGGGFGRTGGGGGSVQGIHGGAVNGQDTGSGKLSLAADFLVQGDGAYGGVVKYGPVVIPSLEFGR